MRKLGIASLVVALLVSNAWAQDKKKAAPPPPPPPAAAAPETVTVTVTQEADIRNGKVAEAKEEAKNRALRAAVEQVVGTHVSSFSESKDFTMLQDYVTAHSTGYVSRFELVNEKVDEEAELVTTTIKADVSKGKIDGDSAAIATLLAQRKQVNMYVSISDRAAMTVGAGKETLIKRHGQFDATLREQLRKDGFVTLDPNFVDGKLKMASGLESLNGISDAVNIGSALKADVIIYGHATTLVTPPAPPKPGQKDLNVENMVYGAVCDAVISVVSPQTEEEIGNYSGKMNGTGFTEAEAIRDANDKAAAIATRDVRRAFFGAWLKQQQSGSHIKVTVVGLKRYADLGELQRMLTNSSHQIKSVASSQFSKGTGTFTLMVGPGVTSDTLATDIGGMAFKGLTISVTDVRPAVLEMELTK